jgi:uncharacterized membrane protein
VPAIVASVTISRPRAEVFAFACDYRNDPMWREGVEAMQVMPEGASRLGTSVRERLRFFGRTMVTDSVVVDYVPGQRIAFTSTRGPLSVAGARYVDDDGDGTRFTFEIEATPTGVYKALQPLMERAFRQRLSGDLERRRGVLERRSSTPSRGTSDA